MTRTQPFVIQCSYSDTVELAYDHVKFTADDVLPAGTVSVTNSWDGIFNLMSYTDETDITSVVNANNNVILGDTLFSQISVTNFPSELTWSVEYCNAASDSTKTSYISLFDNYECKNDIFHFAFTDRTADQYYYNQNDFYNFNFQAFSFGESLSSDSSIYLVCLSF